jgi:hypothetical protein
MKKALLACTLLSAWLAVPWVSAANEQTLYGYVSCAKCEDAKVTSDAHLACMRQCSAKGGEGGETVLVTDNDHQLVHLENPETVSGHYAHRVALNGYMKGNVFHVISVRTL